jgi:transposase
VTKCEWAIEGRGHYGRNGLCYPSDLTDQEWAVAELVIPPGRGGGNKRTADVRRILDGLLYKLSTGCPWTAIPKDMPPRTTLNEYFRRWDYDGTLAQIHQTLFAAEGLNESLAGSDGNQVGTPDAIDSSRGWTYASTMSMRIGNGILHTR